jgi:hypothetical protein
MSNSEALTKFTSIFAEHIANGSFVKLSLGNYNGNDKGLRNIYIKPVKIKRIAMLSFNYRYQTRDIFKNYTIDEGLKLVENLLSNDFRIGTLFTVAQEIIIEHQRKGPLSIRERDLAQQLQPNISHYK